MKQRATGKFGLTGFSEVLQLEIGEHGLRVAIIEPGATKTEVATGTADATMQEAMQQHVSCECTMQPAHIAEAIMFLLS